MPNLYVASMLFTGTADNVEDFHDALFKALGGDTETQIIHAGTPVVINCGRALEVGPEDADEA